MAKIFDKVSQGFLDAIKGVLESSEAYGKSVDKMKDDEKKKNISASDTDKISKLAAMMKAEKKPVKEAKGDVTVKTKSSADSFAQHTGQTKNKMSAPKDPKSGKTLFQKVSEENDEGWYTHSQMYGSKKTEKHPKGISADEWKAGVRWDHRNNKRINVKEDVDQIDELKSDTEDSYYLKATRQQMSSPKDSKTFQKRKSGRDRYMAKRNAELNKEEAEQIDEISKATMGRYINKAKDQIDAASWRSGYRQAKPNDPNSQAVINAKEKQLSKRHGGIELAVKKLTKEEAEQIDEKLSDEAKKVIKTTVDKTGAKVRPLVKLAMMAKDKGKPVSEAMDLPWKEDPKNPSHKIGTHKDKYGNVVKNVAKHLAKKAMKANEAIDPDLEKEMKATRVTKKSMEDAKKKYGVKKEEADLEEAYGMWKVEFPKQHAGKDVAAGSVHVKAQNTAHAHKVAAKRVGVDHKVFKSKVTKSSILPEEAEQIDEILDTPEKVADYKAKAQKSFSKNVWKGGEKAHRTATKRAFGLSHPKVANEEAEQIDELSKKTLGSYVKQASKQASTARGYEVHARRDQQKDMANQEMKLRMKREKGIQSAVDKLTKEDQDFIDSINDMMFDEIAIAEARGRPKKAAAKDFTIHPKTKEKLMHDNPEHMKKIELLQKNGILPKPKTEASQHIINQLHKAKTSMTGGTTIHFTHGDSKEVSGAHAAKLLDKYAGMKPDEKEAFQKKIGHSHAQLMKHV